MNVPWEGVAVLVFAVHIFRVIGLLPISNVLLLTVLCTLGIPDLHSVQ